MEDVDMGELPSEGGPPASPLLPSRTAGPTPRHEICYAENRGFRRLVTGRTSEGWSTPHAPDRLRPAQSPTAPVDAGALDRTRSRTDRAPSRLPARLEAV